MRRGVDPAGQARDHREADSGQARGQALGDPQSVRGAVAASRPGRWRAGRAARSSPLAVEQAGRVGDVLERRRIAGSSRAGGRRTVRPRRQSSSSAFGVAFLATGPARSCRRASGRRPARRGARTSGVEHPPGRAEPLEQRLRRSAGRRRGPSCSRTRSRRSASAAARSSVAPLRATASIGRASPAPPSIRPPGRVGQLDAPERRGRTSRSGRAPVLLVAAHGVEQLGGVVRRRGPSSAGRSVEQGPRSGGTHRARSSPAARPAGTRPPSRRRRPRRAERGVP